MHAFLYTNDFKDFTLETAARNPPAGARLAHGKTRWQIARLISLLLLLLLLLPLLWLEEFDLLKGVKPGLILTSPQAGLTQDMVVPCQGCQMRCRVEPGMDRSKRKHLFIIVPIPYVLRVTLYEYLCPGRN
jgi:hypothetical protein